MASDLEEETGAYNLQASPHLSSLTYNDPLFRVSRPAFGPSIPY